MKRSPNLVVFAVFVVLIGCTFAGVAVVRFARGDSLFFYNAILTEFFVCEGPDPTTGQPKESIREILSTVETIYACGYLEAEGSVPVHFVLFYEGQSTRWIDAAENYRTGYVFQELPHSWREPGDYYVEARLGRHLMATAGFTIVR